jgi:hypothetical protein
MTVACALLFSFVLLASDVDRNRGSQGENSIQLPRVVDKISISDVLPNLPSDVADLLTSLKGTPAYDSYVEMIKNSDVWAVTRLTPDDQELLKSLEGTASYPCYMNMLMNKSVPEETQPVEVPAPSNGVTREEENAIIAVVDPEFRSYLESRKGSDEYDMTMEALKNSNVMDQASLLMRGEVSPDLEVQFPVLKELKGTASYPIYLEMLRNASKR